MTMCALKIEAIFWIESENREQLFKREISKLRLPYDWTIVLCVHSNTKNRPTVSKLAAPSRKPGMCVAAFTAEDY